MAVRCGAGGGVVVAVVAVALVLGALPASGSASVPRRVQDRIRSCYGDSPRVWLTFDDGGGPAQVRNILDVLDRRRVRAMFFPTGLWAARRPQLVRRMVRAGHVVGNHTYGHVGLSTVSDSVARWQIRHGVRGNARPRPLLRPPYGDSTFSVRLTQLAAAQGMRLCAWTVDTRDWAGASTQTIVHRVVHGDAWTPPVRAGGVVLMHLQGPHTAAALPHLITAVTRRGLTLHRLPRPRPIIPDTTPTAEPPAPEVTTPPTDAAAAPG